MPDDPAPAPLDADRAAVLAAMAEAGVPLDVAPVRVPPTRPADLAHRRAAAVAVDGFAARRGLGPAGPTGHPAGPAELTGRPVSRTDLLGRHYDGGRLVLPAGPALVCTLRLADPAVPVPRRRPLASGPYRRSGDPTPLWFVADPAGVRGGLSGAFVGGPHRLRADAGEAQRLFDDFLDTVLRQPRPEVEAYEWVGDFSPYFAAGLEWGEAWAWTVRTSPTEVVVAALSVGD